MIAAPVPAAFRRVEIDVGDGTVPVALAGSGPPILLLHGWTLDRRMWSPQIGTLMQGFTLAMPDRRGFGEASAPPDLAREAEDVERIADTLDFEGFALIGHSQGAAVALDCALRLGARISALIVSGAPLPGLVPRDEAIDLDRYRQWAGAGDMAAMRADWSRHPLMHHANPGNAALLARILADYTGRDLLAPSSLADIPREALAQMPMPVLALAGTDDSRWRRACAQALAEAVPHGVCRFIEGAGHLANLDAPERFNDLVRAFLLPQSCDEDKDDAR